MKRILLIFSILIANSTFAQTYFSTTSSSSGANTDITHLGSLVIGNQNNGYIPNPWVPYNGLLLIVDNQNKHSSIVVKNDFGSLSMNVAASNGAFYPISQQGDIVFKKHTAKHMIFSLNNNNNDGNSAFIFGDSQNHRTLTILNNGKVGIGTGTPDTELAVNGEIHAKKVRVDLTGWSDFVFEKTYKLPTLKEVEKQIKEKGHLKGIPTTKEVVKNGVDLGKIATKLLQKVEELTLYTIQQQKLIEKMQQEIVQLKKK